MLYRLFQCLEVVGLGSLFVVFTNDAFTGKGIVMLLGIGLMIAGYVVALIHDFMLRVCKQADPDTFKTADYIFKEG